MLGELARQYFECLDLCYGAFPASLRREQVRSSYQTCAGNLTVGYKPKEHGYPLRVSCGMETILKTSPPFPYDPCKAETKLTKTQFSIL